MSVELLDDVSTPIEKYAAGQGDLQSFLSNWKNQYNQKVKLISLFDNKRSWTSQQKQYFARVFYHARGHFIDFLWYLGNNAPDKEAKDIVLTNIADEFGGYAASHEALYESFANSIGVCLEDEFIENNYNLAFIKTFNTAHLRWLYKHDWLECFSAFSAYELLDNLDYLNLYDMVKKWDIPSKGLVFFKVHTQVEHFGSAYDYLSKTWEKASYKVRKAFDFIGSHQLQMWDALSNEIFKLPA